MKKLSKVFVIHLLVLSFIINNHSLSYASVNDTKKEALAAYKSILVDNPYEDMEGGFTAETFNLIDVTGDDIPELIINEEAPQILTYIDGNVIFMYNSWIYCSIYYSKKTSNFMFTMGSDKEKYYQIFKYTDIANYETKDIVNLSFKNKKYYKYDVKSEADIVISKKTFNKFLTKYMPDYIKLETPYKNTDANIKKYIK